MAFQCEDEALISNRCGYICDCFPWLIAIARVVDMQLENFDVEVNSIRPKFQWYGATE